jgi:hypothetical protein
MFAGVFLLTRCAAAASGAPGQQPAGAATEGAPAKLAAALELDERSHVQASGDGDHIGTCVLGPSAHKASGLPNEGGGAGLLGACEEDSSGGGGAPRPPCLDGGRTG